MEKDRNELKRVLAERLAALMNTPVPKGLASYDDVDIDIFEYDGHIAGLAQSYLADLAIDPALVSPGDDLSRKLDECEGKLLEFRAYKNLVSEVASILLECLMLDR